MYTDVTMSEDLCRRDSGYVSREMSGLSLNSHSPTLLRSSNGYDDSGDSSDSGLKITASMTVKKTQRAGKKAQRKKRQDGRWVDETDGCYQVDVSQVLTSEDKDHRPVSRTVYSDGSVRSGAVDATDRNGLSGHQGHMMGSEVGTVTIGNVHRPTNDTGMYRGQGCQMPSHQKFKQNGHHPHTPMNHQQHPQCHPETFRVDVFCHSNSKTLRIDMAWESTVDDLKRKIYQQVGIVPDQQRLVYNGKNLYEGHKLTSYGLQHYDSVNRVLLTTKLRGG